MADGDVELSGSRLPQPALDVGARARRPARPPARPRHRPSPASHSAARSACGGAEPPGAGPDERPRLPAGRNSETAAAAASGPSRRPAAVVRRWWASNAAATRESSGSAGARSTRPATESVSSTGHPGAAQTPASRASSSPVIRSSSADAVMRVAPASSSGSSWVMSVRLVSTTTGAPSAAGAGEVGGGDLEQIGVPVVRDPVLRPRQERREPSAHRPGAAGEVVDHPAAGCREAPPDVRDEVAGPGRSVGRLAEVEPSGAHADLLDRHRAAPARTPDEHGRGGRPPGERRAPLAGGPAQPPPQIGVAEPGPKRCAERGRVAGRDEKAGARPVGAVTEGLRHAADLGCHDRQAAGQRLGDDHAVRLGAGRQHQQVGGGVAAGEIGLGLRPRKAHPSVQPALSSEAAEAIGERRVAVEAAHAPAVPVKSRHRGERIEQHVMALAGDHRRDGEQRPGGLGSRREVGGIDAGLGDVHAIAGQGIELEEPSPGPPAGRDDRSGGREDGALLRPVTLPAVAERHVHEHHQPQPARLRQQHLRGRRGDQPVEQHDGAVGDPVDDTREGGVRRCAGPRPGAGHGVDVHRPARVGELAAHPAVIRVASARPGRIVDAVRHHNMHRRHSARS